MTSIRRPVLALLVGALTGLSSQAQLATPVQDVGLERLSDTGSARGFATLGFDRGTYDALDAAHGARRPAALTLPLPGDREVEVVLRPTSVWEPGGTATVVEADGSEHALAPSVRTFAVYAPGRASTGFLGVSPDMLHGYLTLGEDTYLLSTGPSDGERRPLAIGHADVFGEGGEAFCNVLDEGTGLLPGGGGARTSALPDLHETKVFIECDNVFRGRFSSNQETIDYATLLVAATSEIYRRDLGATIYIPSGYVRVWNTTPGWGVITTFSDVNNVQAWWNSGANTKSGLARAQVHVLSYPVFGGVANGIGLLCSKTSSYAISSCYGSFPYPIQHRSGSNWDLYVFAHESGHLYGSQHTFDYIPPIDCNDGTGPDKGTIMSYCHQTFGISGVGMRFHHRVQDNLRGDIGFANCPKVIPIDLGDYDANGLIDAVDLAAYDAYVAQGFVSRGAFETFDMDQDGQITSIDRQLLQAGSLPPSSATVVNGSGANCGFCFTSQTPPILGKTWVAFVGSYLGVIPTTVMGSASLLPAPSTTKYGEFLLGSPIEFTHNAMTNGQWATHEIPIPLDPAFAGVTVYTQAAMFKPSGVELVNGLALTLSTY